MKRFLLVLLIAVLAIGAVFADFSFSGAFKVGHKFDLDAGTKSIIGRDSANAGRFIVKATGDWFTVTFKGNLNSRSSSTEGTQASANINVVKLFSAADIALPENLKLSADVGYQNPSSTTYTDLAGTDHNIKFGVSVANFPIALTAGYDSYTVKFAYDIIGEKFGVEAKADNIVDGVSARVAYSTKEKALDGSVSVDVKKLAGFDFDAKVAGYVMVDTENSDNNKYIATITGEYQGIDLGVEFNHASGKNVINGQVGYKFKDVKLTPEVTVLPSYNLTDSEFGIEVDLALSVDKLTFEVDYDITGKALSVYTLFAF